MPFAAVFDRLYNSAIRPAIELSGYVAERYDDIPRTGAILDEIFRGIEGADLVVALVTDKNPHVFFELGIAVALGRRCILLARSADDVPCFLAHLPCVLHGDAVEMARQELVKELGRSTTTPSVLPMD